MDGHCQFNKRTNHTYDILCYVFYTSNHIRVYYIIYGYVGLFNIYNKDNWRKIMAKDTMKEMLKMIDAKIEHIEDITADNRAIIVKLVKQNNQIVEFLKQLELEIVDSSEFIDPPRDEKLAKLMDLVEQFKEHNEEFKKFVEEMEENKDKLTPGQFGES
tara:strand:- start:218 stop:694 length:477 start_codon:yes stop_codon:yes gene_type:complete